MIFYCGLVTWPTKLNLLTSHCETLHRGSVLVLDLSADSNPLSDRSPRDGNLPDIVAAGSMHEFLLNLHGKYGAIASFWFGPKFTVSIASPELFREHMAPFDRPRKCPGRLAIKYSSGAV